MPEIPAIIHFVTPTQVGVQGQQASPDDAALDSGLRRNDTGEEAG